MTTINIYRFRDGYTILASSEIEFVEELFRRTRTWGFEQSNNEREYMRAFAERCFISYNVTIASDSCELFVSSLLDNDIVKLSHFDN